MPDTPFFPAWRAQLHRPRPLQAAFAQLGRCTLAKLEERFAPFLAGLAELGAAGRSARERPYSVRRTWWCFLWQTLHRTGTCREVVRQLQAMLLLEGRAPVSNATGAYCQARERLPESLLSAALKASAKAADQRVTPGQFLQGRPLKGLDGTTLTLPDTPENQALYPQLSSQKPGCGFPMLHLVVVWSARAGAILDFARGDYHHSEMRLVHQLCPTFASQDIIIYDRAAGHYTGCALVQKRGADLISRVLVRKIDWRRGQRLGRDERLVVWPKTREQPAYLTASEWDALPPEITVRVIRLRVKQPGFCTREISLVTTLLDAKAYPREEIAAAFLRRWRLEMCLDDLKTTLGLDLLRCKKPETVHRELLTLFVAHNLTRALMAEAARVHAVPLDRLSFKGTLDALRQFCSACAQTQRPALRRRLWSEMLRLIAADQVPLRPNRFQPRVVKRRPKSYPKLNRPRHLYRDTRHGCRFRQPSST